MKILIAEDDQYIREGLRDLLEAEGYQTVMAVDGADAMAKYHEATPHLVLLDIMMPGKDGYTVCREIRGHSSQVPVIFLSAKSEEIDRVIGARIMQSLFLYCLAGYIFHAPPNTEPLYVWLTENQRFQTQTYISPPAWQLDYAADPVVGQST